MNDKIKPSRRVYGIQHTLISPLFSSGRQHQRIYTAILLNRLRHLSFRSEVENQECSNKHSNLHEIEPPFTHRLPEAHDNISCIEFIPDRYMGSISLLSASRSGTIILWKQNKLDELSFSKCVEEKTRSVVIPSAISTSIGIQEPCVNRLAINPSDTYFVAAIDSCNLPLYQISSSSFHALQFFSGHSSYIIDVQVHQKHSDLYLSTSLDQTCRIWHPTMKNPVFTLDYQRNSNNHISLSSACFAQPHSDPYHIITCGHTTSTNEILSDGSEIQKNEIFLWDIRYHKTYLTSILHQSSQDSSLCHLTAKNKEYESFSDVNTNSLYLHDSDSASSEDDERLFDTWGIANIASASSRKRKSKKKAKLGSNRNDQFKPVVQFHSDNLKKNQSYFDKTTQTYRQKFVGHHPAKKVYHCVSSSCGQYLLTTCLDNNLKLWNTAPHYGDNTLFNINTHGILETKQVDGMHSYTGCNLLNQCIPRLSRDDKLIFCGGNDGNLYVWNTFPGNLSCNYSTGGTNPFSNSSTLSNRRISTQNATIDMNGNYFCKVNIHKNPIQCMAINDDNSLIATCDSTGIIKFVALGLIGNKSYIKCDQGLDSANDKTRRNHQLNHKLKRLQSELLPQIPTSSAGQNCSILQSSSKKRRK